MKQITKNYLFHLIYEFKTKQDPKPKDVTIIIAIMIIINKSNQPMKNDLA